MTGWDDQGNDLGQFSVHSLRGKAALNHPFTGFLSAGVGLSCVGEKIDGRAAGAGGVDADFRVRRPRLGAGLINQLTLGVNR